MLKNGWKFQPRNHQLKFIKNLQDEIKIPTSRITSTRRLNFTTSSPSSRSSQGSPSSNFDSDSGSRSRAFFKIKSSSYEFYGNRGAGKGRGSTNGSVRGRRESQGYQRRKPFQIKPSAPVNFNPPSKLDQANVKIQLSRALRSFSSETSTHLTTRLISFGLKGEAIRWLLAAVQYSTTKTTKNQIKGRGFTAWKREMKNREVLDDTEVVARLVRSWCRIALDQLFPTKEEETTSTFESAAKWDYDSISDSLAYEGDSALPRIVVSEFLAWVQKELVTLKKGQLNIQSLQPNRNMQDSSNFTSEELESLNQATSQTYSSILYFKSPPEPLDSETISNLSSSATSCLSLLSSALSTSDLSHPPLMFMSARSLTRNIHLHVGPTNSGKTHAALVALTKAKTGIFAGPLRLLAHEVFERINAGTVSPGVPPRACNLLTGEEQRVVDPLAGIVACTVEMAPLDTSVDVAVIDEIQMMGDSQRGSSWTTAVLGIAARDLHLCGEPSVIPLIQKLADSCGDKVIVHRYQRLTPLKVAEKSLGGNLKNIQKGDCVVTFSRSGIFAVKEKIERLTGLKCAVVYGSLPPETKSEQARLFNEAGNEWDVMVASDAVGMGLNLKIKRVVFETISKWDGTQQVYLSSSQIKQIAGRAGRYGTSEPKSVESDKGSTTEEEEGGVATTLQEEDLEVLQKAMEAPIVPVARANLRPPFLTLERLSVTIPPEYSSPINQLSFSFGSNPLRPTPHTIHPDSSISSIYANLQLLAKIDSSTYYLSDFSQQHSLSSLVERASRFLPIPLPSKSDSQQLSVKDQTKLAMSQPVSNSKMRIPSLLSLDERETLSNAPADVKDPLLVTWFHGAVSSLVGGKLVDFKDIENEMGLGMTRVLEDVEELQTIKSKAKAKAQSESQVERYITEPQVKEVQSGSKEDVIEEEKIPNSKKMEEEKFEEELEKSSSNRKETKENQASVSALTLSTLESLHRSLSLYLWLAFRFPLSFCYKIKVEGLKKRTELAIEWGLEDMRQSRKVRLQALGRSPDETKMDRKNRK